MTHPVKFELIQEEPGTGQVLVPFIKSDIIETTWLVNHIPKGFNGKYKDTYQVYLSASQLQIMLLGLGEPDQLAGAYLSFISFCRSHCKNLERELTVDLRHLNPSLVYQCVLGFGLADYTVGVYKTKNDQNFPLQTVRLLVADINDELERQLFEAQQAADVVKEICALVDAPANIKTPQYLAQWALDSARQYDYSVTVLDHRALAAQNLQALLAVGRGSENRPVLISATYSHPDLDAGQVDLGLVGKGVTFDTGGISLKNPANMHYMKCDMAGAAAVLGAMELIARLKLPLNVVAVIPVAENSVDAHSIRPGDVIQSHSGKSIEVIDTDAEGRLILADALSYIQRHHHPETLIDLATLTGNCVTALGYEAAGLFTQDEELARAISEAGETSGERVWRLPLWERYRETMDSDIADIKNLSSKPVAGAITAAKFLEYFIEDSQRWAHLDIAGTAFGDTEYAKMKSATGYGVRLLVHFAISLIAKRTS